MPTKTRWDLESGSDYPAETVAPPLTPSDMPIPGDALRRASASESNVAPAWGRHHPVRTPEQSDSPVQDGSFRRRGKLIVGIAVLAALALGTLAYILLSSEVEKSAGLITGAEPAQSPPVPPVPETQSSNQLPSPSTPEPSSMPSGTRSPAPPAWPEPPPSLRPMQRADAPPQVAPAAPKGDLAQRRPPVAAAQNRDVLFLQRPGVNIRSAPTLTSNVVGTAPKGTRFEVTNRDGEWVQVESGQLKGWINGQFLAPAEPQ